MKHARCLAWFALLFIASTTFVAQDDRTDRTKARSGGDLSNLKDSVLQAAAIVDRAIGASGGHARLDTLKLIRLDFEAEVAATYQGPSPKNPHRYLPRTGDLFFDIGQRQLITSSETRWPNFTTTDKSLFRDGKTFRLDDQTKTFRESNDAEVIEAWTLRLIPVMLKRLKDKSWREDHRRTDHDECGHFPGVLMNFAFSLPESVLGNVITMA